MAVSKISEYSITRRDKFFLDTNVWFFLLYPGNTKKKHDSIQSYSSFFKNILNQGSLILTHPQLFSEFINVWLRKKYKKFLHQGGKIEFKEYRNSETAKGILKDIKVAVERMLQNSELISGSFNSDDMKAIVLKCDQADFNDIVYAEICVQQRCILVTDDFDFDALAGRSGIHVITANKNYH